MLKYLIYAILSGLILSFSWPPYGIPLLLFIGFVPLLLLEHQLSQDVNIKRKSFKLFGLSFISFLLWNGITIWWLHYAKQFGENGELENSWLAYSFAIIANALFMSIVFQLYHWVKTKAGNHYGFIFLPSFWMVFEKFHLNWEMSWPWLNLGNGFAGAHQWIQWYEYTGTFGGTLWIWIVNLIVFYFYTAYKNTQHKKFLIKLIIYPLLWISIPIALSYLIYYNYEEKGEDLTALALQPNLNPYTEKYSKDSFTIVNELLELINQNITPNTQFIVAPETAFPGSGPGLNIDKLENDFLLNNINNDLKKHPNTTLISGVSLMRFYPYQKLASKTASRYGNSNTWYDSFNSAIQLTEQKTPTYYHKSKLVVGVEHSPYRNVLEPLLGDLLMNFGGTMSTLGTQKERTVFTNSLNNAKVAPMICYESIYGEYNTEFVRNGANVFFTMSNDSWWGNTAGHKQLLLYGNLRAIENRRSIVRSANSGISAFINQKGDITSSLAYEKKGALLGTVKMNNEITFYSSYGDYIARLALLLTGILLAYTLAHKLLVGKENKK